MCFVKMEKNRYRMHLNFECTWSKGLLSLMLRKKFNLVVPNYHKDLRQSGVLSLLNKFGSPLAHSRQLSGGIC